MHFSNRALGCAVSIEDYGQISHETCDLAVYPQICRTPSPARRDDAQPPATWMPACAGMTIIPQQGPLTIYLSTATPLHRGAETSKSAHSIA